MTNNIPFVAVPQHSANSVGAFVQRIFDVIILSPEAIAIIQQYFITRVKTRERARFLLRFLLRLDDEGTATVLQPFGTLDSAANYHLKTFRQWYQRN